MFKIWFINLDFLNLIQKGFIGEIISATTGVPFGIYDRIEDRNRYNQDRTTALEEAQRGRDFNREEAQRSRDRD